MLLGFIGGGSSGYEGVNGMTAGSEKQHAAKVCLEGTYFGKPVGCINGAFVMIVKATRAERLLGPANGPGVPGPTCAGAVPCRASLAWACTAVGTVRHVRIKSCLARARHGPTHFFVFIIFFK